MASRPHRDQETHLDRREVILARAAELLARKGVAATTVREIGEAAGILSGSLYHHFPSKDAIVDAVVSGYFEDLLRRYEAVLHSGDDPVERFHGLVRATLAVVDAHPHATAVYQHDMNYLHRTPRFAHVVEAAGRVRQLWLDLIEDGAARGAFRTDIAPEVMYPILRDGLWLTVRWFRARPDYDHDALAADCCRLFLQGIGLRDDTRLDGLAPAVPGATATRAGADTGATGTTASSTP